MSVDLRRLGGLYGVAMPDVRNVRLTFRPYVAPLVEQPLSLRSVGRGTYGRGVYEDRQVRTYSKLLWVLRGEINVRFADRNYIAPERSMVVLFPGMPHWSRGNAPETELRWATYDGQSSAMAFSQFGLDHAGVHPNVDCPTERLESLRCCLEESSIEGEIRAGTLSYGLLLEVGRGMRSEGPMDPVVEEVKRQLDRRGFDPALTVDSLADGIGMNRSSLSRRFGAVIGVSPKRYIINMRIQRAVSLLKQTDVPVSAIARECGYPDVNYFIRLFKRKVGMPPRDFRNHGG